MSRRLEPEHWNPPLAVWIWALVLFLLASANIVAQFAHQNDSEGYPYEASDYDEALDACWDQFDADEPSDAVSVCQRTIYKELSR